MLKRSNVNHLSWLSLLLPVTLSMACSKSPPTPPSSPSPSPVVAAQTLPQFPTPIIGKPYPATGVVKLINHKEGWIEIDHDPIEGLMPAMQMEWTVQPPSLMRPIKVGDKVEFTVVETGKGEIITSLKTVPPAR